MDQADLDSLEAAVAALERPPWAMQITDLVGMPIEAATKLLPHMVGDRLFRTTNDAIGLALRTAVRTMGKTHGRRPAVARWLHRAAVGASGAMGGFFGVAALAAELPVSTCT